MTIGIVSSWSVVDGSVFRLGLPAPAPRPVHVCANPDCRREFRSRGPRLWCRDTCRPGRRPKSRYTKESQRRRRVKARALGLCTACCTGQPEPGRKTCPTCIERRRAWRDGWKAVAPAACVFGRPGACLNCGDVEDGACAMRRLR